MYIYKITNLINKKIYIGQVYNKSVEQRFNRHISEASPNHSILVDRAIYKYGSKNFICECIDIANSLQELSQKEKYWISYYNSTNLDIGYNLTPGGDGGNTYLNKTPEQLKEIGNKISIALTGSNNGMSRKVKCINTITKEEIIFDTIASAAKHFGIKNNSVISEHCNNKAKYLYKNKWNFAYYENQYNNISTYPNTTRGYVIDITDNNNVTTRLYSLNKVYDFLGLKKSCTLKLNQLQKKFVDYKFERIN